MMPPGRAVYTSNIFYTINIASSRLRLLKNGIHCFYNSHLLQVKEEALLSVETL